MGATNEIGVFEMDDTGLREVPNPSQMLLEGRLTEEPGTCVTCVRRVPALYWQRYRPCCHPTSFGTPRRAPMVLIITGHAAQGRSGKAGEGWESIPADAYLNVIGGLYLDEPGADLAAVLALASSFRDKPVPPDLVAVGEVGLTGELRSVSALSQRLSEVRRLGFTKCLVPQRHGRQTIVPPTGLQLIPVKNIREALAVLL